MDGGYGLNWVYMANFDQPKPVDSCNTPAETILLTDSTGYYAVGGSGGPADGWWVPVDPRHNGMVNVAWADGHVSSRRPEQIKDDSRNKNLNSTNAAQGHNPAPANANSFWDMD